MKYDFDTLVERRGTYSLKWDVGENELPMWVADMDFKTAPEIIAAVEQRAKHGVFGYSVLPEEWRQAVIGWWETRHHFLLRREWLLFCSGVIPAISSAVRKFTAPGDHVLVQPPVYNVFFNCIANNGREILENRLIYDGENYQMDFEDLERKLAEPQTTMMILCNPHNPVGKLWDKQTLEKVGELCWKHHVLVISDEIHCDMTAPGQEYIPFASAGEKCRDNSITCAAPTKTFNFAGLQSAVVIVPEKVLREKMECALVADEIGSPNVFAPLAAIAAYTEGAPWLDALREYVFENKRLARQFLEKEIPQIKALVSPASYLLWLDCAGASSNSTQLQSYLRRETGLYLTDGKQYRADGSFLRMNIACPREILSDGLERLRRGIVKLQANPQKQEYEL